MSRNDAKSKVKKGQTELEKSLREGGKFEQKIKEQKRLNALKVAELGAASDEYPAAVVDVSTEIRTLDSMIADLLFLQEPAPLSAERNLDLQRSRRAPLPLLFLDKSVPSSMQKCIVPC